MIFNFKYETVAVGITLLLLMLYLKNRVIKTRQLQIFGALVFFTCISSAFDIMTVLMYQNPTEYSFGIQFTINTLYQMSFHIIAYIYFFFMVMLYDEKKHKSVTANILISIPYFISFVLDITNYFTKAVFYFDENMVYHQGPFLIYMYIQAWFYLLIGIIIGLKNKNKISRENKVTLFFYIIANAISLVVQLFLPNLLITGFILATSLLLTFLCLENPQDYIDREMGVYNRIAFVSIVPNIFKERKNLEVVGIKFEEMKYLNDTIGIFNRMQLLKSIASFLQATFGKYNVFRISRSKISVILSKDPEERENQIKKLQEKLLEPFETNNVKLSLSVYLDIIKCPEDTDNIEDLLDLLENSFSDLLTPSRLSIVTANKEILEKRKRENQILMILENAIEKKEFEVVYQPIYSIKSHKYTAAEALLRLKNSTLGIIKPEEFIPIAEKNGMILKIGNFVFKEVCRFVSRSRITESDIKNIHINLSVVQCMQEKLHQQLFEIMDNYDIPYSYINLDITENTAYASKDILKKNMQLMKQKNMSFALDDYGIGFTNTANIIKYAFSTIKINKKLFWDALKDQKARVILNQTVQMLKELNMEVVAEGIETKELVEMASEIGCDYIQGYYYSYPLNEKDFVLFMR
ncbi:MAG: EAL domain-containing protein [Treponema sp.]|nr:EAL domain-containing protein [Treponema sp.]